jgi:hypothetical protein
MPGQPALQGNATIVHWMLDLRNPRRRRKEVRLPVITSASAFKTTLAAGMFAAAAATGIEASGGTGMTDWMALVKDFGILATLVFFFTWANWKREERFTDRLAAMEDFQTTELLTCVKTSATALQDNTNALANLQEALYRKPCLASDENVMTRLERVVEKMDQVQKTG